ncbi:hypothetical protein EVAR_36046_1 [Eumeta japonica]|uniref:TIL domain-containing protein n=1 Tax=Eumeta variegata TaxID=151549 RepID=A0A4C1WQA3_EUMVA|nr:hypothetical protein EVAR_36046_1 [Eumeta japonica]
MTDNRIEIVSRTWSKIGECRALNCSQLGQPLACASVDADSCKKGCICAQGYVRDKKGKCIPQDTCPEGCGGDPNAKTGCSNYCRHSCSDYNEPGGACALFCIVNGCACKDNYVYDSSSNKCVLPKDCPPKCPKNEVYSTCIQGECRALNCSQLGQPLACASVDADSCKKGCICAQGYVRDKKGKCIPQDTCPEGCGGDPNAKTGCNNYCGDSCLDYNKTDVICTDICTLNGCSCKDNYVYDSTSKKCVLPKDCNVGCGGDPNAVSGCAGYCGTKCTTSNWNAQQRKLLCVHACIKGCKCISGYLYDEKVKKCVPPEDCS